MSMRASSLLNGSDVGISREIGSQYDVVKKVSEYLAEIEILANEDLEAIAASLNEAKDFTGITVVSGAVTSWDPVTKVLTVATVKGDKGDKGDTGDVGPQGIQGIQGIRGAEGPKGEKGDQGAQGPIGFQGPKGDTGDAGADGQDLTVEQIVYNNDGTFTWQFSDGTSYTTPDLRGEKGEKGAQGLKGDTGTSVHHLKGTSTTNSNGDFGVSPFRDTYTLYGDASETIVLGYFTVANGISDGMSASVYDSNVNGIVDNSERLGNELPEHYVNVVDNQYIAGNKTFANDITIQGDLTVNGTQTTVNSETVTVKDNLLVINSGEVGAGVTSGEAGIEVDRGTEENFHFKFDEADDSFKIGKISGLQKVATREDAPLGTGVAVWNDAEKRFDTTRDVEVDSITLSGGTGEQGKVSWNVDEETLDIVQNGAVLQVGQEVQTHCRNTTGSSIADSTVVMVTGTLGASGRITVAPYDGTSDVKYIIGVTTEVIPNGDDGKVTKFGKIRNIDTTTWNDGDVLYAAGNGGLTNVEPVSGVKIPIAFVVHSASNGTMMVRCNNLDENAYQTPAEVDAKIASIVDSAPTTLNTLNKLANALSDDPNFATTVATNIGNVNSELQNHKSDTSNPHSVTKAQVGLSNVDNTADAVKNVLSATKWTTARTLSLTGAVTGSASIDGSGNVSLVTTHTSDPVITLTGDISGSATMTNLGNVSITATVADDSHNHTIANVDGLQTALNSKQAAGTYNTVIGTDTDVNTSGATIIDNLYMTDGVITSHGTRTLTLADLGYTGETNATADQTPSEILTAIKTVDGSGSGLDADTLDGQQGSYYRDASNITAGTINDARLPDTITSSITGNAATATKLATARSIALSGDITGSANFDGSGNITITATVADDSHNHTIANVDGLQTALDNIGTVAEFEATLN